MKDNPYIVSVLDASRYLGTQVNDIYNMRDSLVIDAVYVKGDSKVLVSQLERMSDVIKARDKRINKFIEKHTEVISCTQVSDLLGLTKQKVRELCRTGKLVCTEYRGAWCIAKSSIKHYVREDQTSKHVLQNFVKKHGDIMTAKEAGAMLNVPARHIKAWVIQGNLAGCSYRRKVYVPLDAILRIKETGIRPQTRGRICY